MPATAPQVRQPPAEQAAEQPAWSTLATTNNNDNGSEAAPVAMFTTTVTALSDDHVQHPPPRVANCTRNQIAETPAAGHTRLRLVASITVRRPA